jgi:hypothetical protein
MIHPSHESESLHFYDRLESFQISVSEICDGRFVIVHLRDDENTDSSKTKRYRAEEAEK